MLHKKSERPHYDIFYFAKTTNQPPSQPPDSAVGKASGVKSQGRGLEPGSDNLIFRIFLFIPKKKYVRAFSQPKSTNQPVAILGIMRSEKRKNQHPCEPPTFYVSPHKSLFDTGNSAAKMLLPCHNFLVFLAVAEPAASMFAPETRGPPQSYVSTAACA